MRDSEDDRSKEVHEELPAWFDDALWLLGIVAALLVLASIGGYV